MMTLIYRFCRGLLLCCLGLGLVGCQVAIPHYIDPIGGYGFDYPAGWEAVEVRDASPGVIVVWRDRLDPTANLSLIANPTPDDVLAITTLGTPTDVGYRFFKEQTARLKAAQSGLQLKFLGAEALQKGITPYYQLEYAVTWPDGRQRHNLASAVVQNQQLFTFNLVLPERRWQQQPQQWRAIVTSFEVF
ncbi:MAG: photosystem II oxygen evolving complex protein PsbP [Spirulina sp. SIO3F2]|nr:photosystem II oxygen evolving complex protein PsbP [Spirulina sp. SIO3F2]